MHFNENFSSLPMHDFQNHYIFVFELTSLQDAADYLHYDELCGESLRLEIFLQFALKRVTKLVVLGERLSKVQNDRSEQTLRIINFLSFQSLIKLLKIIWRLSMLLCLYYLFSSSLDINLFNWKPENFFNLDGKTVFKFLHETFFINSKISRLHAILHDAAGSVKSTTH